MRKRFIQQEILEQNCNPACLPVSSLLFWKLFGASTSFSMTQLIIGEKAELGSELETPEALFPLSREAAVGKLGFSKLNMK